MAKMHLVAETFEPPVGFMRHDLDANGTMGENPFWGRFWDHPTLSADDASFLDDLRRTHPSSPAYSGLHERLRMVSSTRISTAITCSFTKTNSP